MPLEHDDLEDFGEQFFDISVNPLAQIITQLLGVLVGKGILTPNEAKAIVASAISAIKDTAHSDGVKENGAKMLKRMIDALDGLPKSST